MPDFMSSLQKIDRAGLTARDVVILNSIIDWPGECGLDIIKRLKIMNRSSVQSNLPRLIKLGLVEDRRLKEARAVPSRYFATDKGMLFIQSL